MNERSDSNVIFSGCGFDGNQPYLDFDHEMDGRFHRRRFHLSDGAFTLRFLEERYCPGSFSLDRLMGSPCTSVTPLVNSSHNHCYACFETTGFNPAFYHMPMHKISPQQRNYNQERHAVYLAWFGPSVVKVGISSVRRLSTRWKEQGARWAVQIAECFNAYEARELEEKISQAFDLPEVIQVATKKKLLRNTIDFREGRTQLEELTTSVLESFPNLNRGKVQTMDQAYFMSALANHHLIDQAESGKISGVPVALIGDILISDNNGQLFMLSLKKWIGHSVLLTHVRESIDFHPQQTALF